MQVVDIDNFGMPDIGIEGFIDSGCESNRTSILSPPMNGNLETILQDNVNMINLMLVTTSLKASRLVYMGNNMESRSSNGNVGKSGLLFNGSSPNTISFTSRTEWYKKNNH